VCPQVGGFTYYIASRLSINTFSIPIHTAASSFLPLFVIEGA
jgi:hypothetical protein